MTGDGSLDPLAAVRADAAAFDTLAAGLTEAAIDPALAMLSALRAEIDAAVSSGTTPEVRRDAALLDAIATGAVASTQDPAVGLLQALRAAVDGVTVPAAAPPADPAPARLPAPAGVPLAAGGRASRRRRVLRTGAAAGSVALALSMSGVAAAAYGSHPGGALYGLRTQTFGRTDDDPVAAEQVLAALQRQAAVAVSAPGNRVVAAKARADLTRVWHLVSAEHDPAAQKSIAASASKVETALAVLPAPVATPGRSPHPVGSAVAGPIDGATARSASPQALAGGGAAAGATAVPVPSAPASGTAEPDASPGPDATPPPTSTPSPSADPTGTPTDAPAGSPAGSPTGSAAPSASASGTSVPSATPSGDPSASASAGSSPSNAPTAVASATLRATPTDRATPVPKLTRAKPKPAKQKTVTATLMTAQLPSSGLPQR